MLKNVLDQLLKVFIFRGCKCENDIYFPVFPGSLSTTVTTEYIFVFSFPSCVDYPQDTAD